MFKNLKGLVKTSEFSGYVFLTAVLLITIAGYLFTGNVLINAIFGVYGTLL